jgi:hypothetical protein
MVNVPSAIGDIKMYFDSTRIIYYNQCQDFIYKNDRIYIVININGKTDTVQFDSGLGDGLFVNIKGDSADLANAELRSVSSVNKRHYVYQKTAFYDISCNLFDSKSYLSHIIYDTFSTHFPCRINHALDKKMMGNDLIPGDSKKIVVWDFENKKVCMYDSISFDTSGFIPVESKISFLGNTYLYLTINKKKYKCTFDTGCEFGVYLNDKKRIKKGAGILSEGIVGYSSAGAVNAQILSSKDTVFLGSLKIGTPQRVTTVDYARRSLVGMPFISKCNWIIDYPNKAVYAKPLAKFYKDFELNIADYLTHIVSVKNNQLTIVQITLSKNPVYPLGAVIKSVNGVLITEENMCEYMNLLNQHTDWSQLRVETEER